jgi:hypothetical protein
MLVVVFFLVLPLTAIEACPGCKESVANEAAETENDDTAAALPWNPAHAYSYSVIFMLSVPAALLIGFGTAFYRLSRKAQQINGFPR